MTEAEIRCKHNIYGVFLKPVFEITTGRFKRNKCHFVEFYKNPNIKSLSVTIYMYPELISNLRALVAIGKLSTHPKEDMEAARPEYLLSSIPRMP